MRRSHIAQYAGALLAVSLLALPALGQNSADKILNPYSADVKKALAPLPGESPRPGLDNGGNESPACRELRLKIERARSTPPPQYDVYPEGPLRDGRRDTNYAPSSIPGPVTASTSRGTFLKPGGTDYGQLGQLETRYINECR
ncbi:hypothetical protein [Herbaspirillum sp.]|uniref:hypothetical protein n=1 Tax=Herbaspirillum sp. TaxID=1890675 RepID=UPI001B15C8CE|nr:hypothetical protein [Herbaspirillum sp.]MBO9537907.1 hypothetical protein [Herbaspirillum sp.]